MKRIIFFTAFLFTLCLYTQNEASNWYFGDQAGVHFNNNGTVVELTDGQLRTDEGCTTISDNNGDLLFYTDGITVWNKLHEPMPNANPQFGNELFGDPSSAQSAIIIPKPNDLNIYYIFTVDTSINEADPDRGFNYSTVDLTLDGGLGDVVSGQKNINLLPDSSEKITAVLKDCDSKSIWVVTSAPTLGAFENSYNTFHAYEVSSSGVNNRAIISTFNSIILDQRGYLKFSPDGTKLAAANATSGLYIYDFDKATGIVSNETFVGINFLPTNNKVQNAYGLEFSPNSNILYVSANYDPPFEEFNLISEQYTSLLQYDLTALDISASEFVLDQRQEYRSALQLGPNRKIYRSSSATYNLGLPYLSVINNPNEIGNASNYEHHAIALSRNSRQGLPPFVSSFFSEKIDIVRNNLNTTYLSLCIGESYTLRADNIPSATYTWRRNGIILPENDFDLEIDTPAIYKVLIELNTGDCDIIEGEAIVEYFEVPVANPTDNLNICDDNNDDIYTIDFSTQSTTILGNQDPLVYTVNYYTSQEDADLDRNRIVGPFENTSNPQQIFTRVGIEGNTGCYDTTQSFTIQIFNTPTTNPVNSLVLCDAVTLGDANPNNGQIEMDLNQLNIQILGNQNILNYGITYYNNITDAESANNPLPFLYTNQTAFNEIIYARLENNFNTNCYDISPPISLIINPLPNYTNTLLFQCDEDGIKDNITIYNLLEAKNTITDNNSNRLVKYFISNIDAQNDNNEISNPEDYDNISNPQTLFVQVIDSDTGCMDIAQLTLQVSSTNLENYDVPPVCDELDSEDGINTFNLDDITQDIQRLNGITLPITYFNTYEDALTESNEIISPYTNTSSPYLQILFARAEDDNACYGISEVTLTINELPQLLDNETLFYCLNTFPETIPINAGLAFGIEDDYLYNWTTGENTFEININSTGEYTIRVTNSNNCSKERTLLIEASNTATFQAIQVKDVSQNNTVTVSVTGEGIYEYALYLDNGEQYRPYQKSNLFENINPGIYTIKVIDIRNNCGIVEDLVSVIGFPKFFTPNNDGFNDTWQVYGVSTMFQPNSKILIFDRYGKLLKEINPVGEGWDGSFNGQRLPNGDYWFTVKLQDGRTYKNHFSLKN